MWLIKASKQMQKLKGNLNWEKLILVIIKKLQENSLGEFRLSFVFILSMLVHVFTKSQHLFPFFLETTFDMSPEHE